MTVGGKDEVYQVSTLMCFNLKRETIIRLKK